jgi:3-hydroxy acid dehydrogenase/malonic semialdehyde reductase
MSELDPRDFTVLVTGATAGIGAATARRFASAGARVILTGRRQKRLDDLVDKLGARTTGLKADVRDQAAMVSAIGGLTDDFAAIDVLVNNAGIAAGMDLAQEADLEGWNATVDTNIKGLLGVTHAVLSGMVARDRGHIINIGSTLAHHPQAMRNVYAASKAFIHQFSLNLRSDLLGTKVRVTCVEAGVVATEFAVTRAGGDEAKAEELYRQQPPLSADDVADAIHWVTTRPPRVNINTLQLAPIEQAFAGMAWPDPSVSD